MKKKKLILICICLWVFTFILFSPSIQFGFIEFDDMTVLLDNPGLYNEHSFLSSLEEILYNYFPREEPLILRDITWAFDSYVFGFKNPVGYHLGNVILNSFNTVLLFVFLLLTSSRFYFSLITAVSFAVIPIHVEPVCWVMGRKDLLVSFFMLTALICQTLYISSQDAQKKRLFYLVTLLCTAAALLSKINALSFFIVLALHQILYPFLNGSREPGDSFDFNHIIKKILPGFIPHLLISLYIYFWYKGIITSWGVLGSRGPSALAPEHIKTLVLFIPLVIGLYVKLLFLPFQYSIFYHWPNTGIPLQTFHIVISVLISLAIVFMTAFTFYKRKDLLFYILAFIILMIPYFNIIYIGIWAANRYIYFSSFCIIAVSADLIIAFASKHKEYLKKSVFIIWLIFIIFNIYQTLVYQKVWQDNHSLWTYENNLKDASVFSYWLLAKSFTISAAEKHQVPELKMQLFQQAETVINKGLKKYESMGIIKNNYSSYETVHYSNLWHLYGIVSKERNDSLDIQLKYFKKSFEILETWVNASMIAKTYYRLALSQSFDKEKHAENSIIFFEKSINSFEHGSIHDYKKWLNILNQYKRNFPFLKEKIEKIEKGIYNRLKNQS
ncbi:hypothetical protein [Desulfonema limicola]|nr:hypothetical protein [Desulfonema limicola]